MFVLPTGSSKAEFLTSETVVDYQKWQTRIIWSKWNEPSCQFRVVLLSCGWASGY